MALMAPLPAASLGRIRGHFPVWAYIPPKPEMLVTMERSTMSWPTEISIAATLRILARVSKVLFSKSLQGMYNAVSCAGPCTRQSDLDTALRYANDLSCLAEEANPRSQRMLGNFPQTFVHAVFLGTVIDLKAALKQAWLLHSLYRLPTNLYHVLILDSARRT
jgi:hypothetical protein